jgi:DNA-binding LacI/PurR family transcriptional regulator
MKISSYPSPTPMHDGPDRPKNPVTMRTLARITGFSSATVSLALRHDPRITDKVRRQIQAAADQLGYIYDPGLARVMAGVARQQNVASREPVALLVTADWPSPSPWTDNPVMRCFHTGVLAALRELHLPHEVFWLGASRLSPARFRKALLSRGIRGAIVMCYWKSPLNIDLDFSGLPTVVLGRAAPSNQLHRFDSDHAAGISCVMDELLDRGFTRPGLALHRSLSIRTAGEWEAVFSLRCAQSPALKPCPPCLFTEPEEAVDWYKEHQPDVVVSNDFPLYEELAQAKVNIPQDTAYVSLSRILPNLNIAGIDLGFESMARCAVRCLWQLMRDTEAASEPSALHLYPPTWLNGASLPQRKRDG